MNLLSKFMLAFVVVGLVGVSNVQAAKKDKKGDTVQGTVAAAADSTGNLKISSGRKKSPTEVTVQTDSATEVTLDVLRRAGFDPKIDRGLTAVLDQLQCVIAASEVLRQVAGRHRYTLAVQRYRPAAHVQIQACRKRLKRDWGRDGGS